jgi:hypothetical protein
VRQTQSCIFSTVSARLVSCPRQHLSSCTLRHQGRGGEIHPSTVEQSELVRPIAVSRRSLRHPANCDYPQRWACWCASILLRLCQPQSPGGWIAITRSNETNLAKCNYCPCNGGFTARSKVSGLVGGAIWEAHSDEDRTNRVYGARNNKTDTASSFRKNRLLGLQCHQQACSPPCPRFLRVTIHLCH